MNQEKYIGRDVPQATISVAVMDSSGARIMECILAMKGSHLVKSLWIGGSYCQSCLPKIPFDLWGSFPEKEDNTAMQNGMLRTGKIIKVSKLPEVTPSGGTDAPTAAPTDRMTSRSR